MPPAAFAEVTAIRPVGPGRFAADVHPEWSIGGKPNGGYLLALLGRAAGRATPHPHPVAASAHYLRPPDPGPVEIAVEVLREGRTASQVRARLEQDGRSCIEALVTLGELTADTKPYWDAGRPERGSEPFENCYRLPSRTPAGIPVPLLDQVEVRLETGSLGFGVGQPSGRGELRGWLSLPDGVLDPLALLFAVDSFPPATFDVESSGWVPTLELTVYVRALAAPGPVQVLHSAHLIDAQRVDEDCWVWDTAGRLVARSTQLAGIRLG